MATNIPVVLVSTLIVLMSATGGAAAEMPPELGTDDITMRNTEVGDEPTSVMLESTMESLPSSRSLIENETNDLNFRNLPELSIFKRTPAGFLGMRGKKEFEYPESNRIDEFIEYYPDEMRTKKMFLQGINRGLLLNSQIPKRAPSGFVGMRGKKSGEAAVGYKRVPQAGFFGVRGKKSNLNSANIYNMIDNLLHESEFEYDYQPSEYETDGSQWEYNQEPIKRTPNQGFFGMRGKRYQMIGGDSSNIDEFEKRAPTGFMGMRGRRSYEIDSEKRQPNGFFGMRGKKMVADDHHHQQSSEGEHEQHQRMKKAVLSQFFGTRGKKETLNSGFFGTRGKKQPFEFRGKFVGVRGKKEFLGGEPLERLENQLQSFDDVTNDEPMKRTPNGFQGMRGKKGSE